MTNGLPNADLTVFDIRKVADYCLNPSHARGRHKARVFREALNLERGDAALAKGCFAGGRGFHRGILDQAERVGRSLRLDATIERHDKSAMVRSIWIVRTGESRPTFITCWVL